MASKVGHIGPSWLTTAYHDSCIQTKEKFAVENCLRKCILSSKYHNRAETKLKTHETVKLMHMCLTYSKTWKCFKTVFSQWSIYYDMQMLWKTWNKNIMKKYLYVQLSLILNASSHHLMTPNCRSWGDKLLKHAATIEIKIDVSLSYILIDQMFESISTFFTL